MNDQKCHELPPVLVEAHEKFNEDTEDGQSLWPSQRHSYCAGFMSGRELPFGSIVLSAEGVGKIRDALRGSLGWFALFNDEDNKKKWPVYVRRCEEALAIIDSKRGGV
jgi:hypothetical protein